MKCYFIFDCVGMEFIGMMEAPSQGAFVRKYLCSNLYRTNPVPLKDLDVCEVDSDSVHQFLDGFPSDFDWQSYKFPASQAEALAPLGSSPEDIEKSFNEKTSDIKNSSSKED